MSMSEQSRPAATSTKMAALCTNAVRIFNLLSFRRSHHFMLNEYVYGNVESRDSVKYINTTRLRCITWPNFKDGRN